MSLPTASSLPNRPLKVAVLGATGAVGQELLTLLAERQFPVAELVLLLILCHANAPELWFWLVVLLVILGYRLERWWASRPQP